MLGAYGWAFLKPIRKLYYNLTITFVSVLVALTRKTHKKASKAAPFFCKFLVLNKLNFTKRAPLR